MSIDHVCLHCGESFGDGESEDMYCSARCREEGQRSDAEASRWQDRIIETIRTYGIEPRDASGNESGDPLDYSADQVAMALGDAATKERAAIVAAMRSWCDTAGEAYGPDAERIVAQLADSFENGEHEA